MDDGRKPTQVTEGHKAILSTCERRGETGSSVLSKLGPDNTSGSDDKRQTFAVISDDTPPESSAIKYI